MRSVKINQSLFFFGLTGVLLQLSLFWYGCSAPDDRPVTAESAVPGRSLYSAKCASCHRLLPPEDYSAQTWKQYVDKYGKAMTASQKQRLLNYLTASAIPDR